jgi:hypothetical protein
MTKIWEDSPEVHAELERLAMEELKARGGIAAAFERADWERRMWEAARDGLKVAGYAAVDAAMAKIKAELGIKGSKGRPREDLTPAQFAAARRAAELIAAGGKIEDWRLARTAEMSPQAFSNQFAWPEAGRKGGARWPDFWGAVAAFQHKDNEEESV